MEEVVEELALRLPYPRWFVTRSWLVGDEAEAGEEELWQKRRGDYRHKIKSCFVLFGVACSDSVTARWMRLLMLMLVKSGGDGGWWEQLSGMDGRVSRASKARRDEMSRVEGRVYEGELMDK
jgi:hypothetical protein